MTDEKDESNPAPQTTAIPSNEIAFDRFKMTTGIEIEVQQLIVKVRVGRPPRDQFVRVNRAAERRLVEVSMIESKENGWYLVAPNVRQALATKVRRVTLYEAITLRGSPFLWVANLPESEGAVNRWHESMRESITQGMSNWVKVVPDTGLGAYKTIVATRAIPDPDWPAMSFDKLLHAALRDRVIDSIEHPVVRKLQEA